MYWTFEVSLARSGVTFGMRMLVCCQSYVTSWSSEVNTIGGGKINWRHIKVAKCFNETPDNSPNLS